MRPRRWLAELAGLTQLAPLAISAAGLFAGGCGAIGDALVTDLDLMPPQLLEVRPAAADRVVLRFDEPAELVPDSVTIAPVLAVAGWADGAEIALTVAQQTIGARYVLRATARDPRGNTLSFVAEFWGYNPRVAGLLINEFSTQGSATRPDAIELLVTSAGNLGGAVLFDGTAISYRDLVVLPPIEVAAGEFVVVHATADGTGQDERQAIDESEHPLALPSAWDFWMRDGRGLSANNGVIAVYASRSGRLLDAVVYSNRNSQSDERYRGFGSKAMLDRTDHIAELGGWVGAGARIAPEDAVSSEHTTSTRSINRRSDATDSNSASDWHTVPTRGATFGAVNRDDRYQ